jgi:hypothetical protein
MVRAVFRNGIVGRSAGRDETSRLTWQNRRQSAGKSIAHRYRNVCASRQNRAVARH